MGVAGLIMSSRGPTVAKAFGDHGGDESVQTYSFLTGPGNETSVEAARHSLAPLSAGFGRLGDWIAVFLAIQEVGIYGVRAVAQGLFRSFAVGDAAGEVRILDGEAASIGLGERADGEGICVDEGLINFHGFR
jgi:hypothetical protein